MPFDVTRTELVWPGKYDENGKRQSVERISLPFQVIERVNESRATREAAKDRKPTLFDVWKGDEGETFDQGWRNKLIWGDNQLVMGSLLEQFAGKVDLIYIDPPFAVGADFNVTTEIGDDRDAVVKEQSLIEEKAYNDTWRDGYGSYIPMMHARCILMRDLLSSTGNLVVNVDWHAAHFVRAMLEDVFGAERFVNEIIWFTPGGGASGRRFARKHQTLLWFTNSVDESSYTFNADEVRVEYETENVRPQTYHFESNRKKRPGFKEGFTWTPNELGKLCPDVWTDIKNLYGPSGEITGYANQKPVALLDRVISACSNEGDLIGDFFIGSGSTAVAAERLGRRWIGCDLSRYGIHLTRKRLLDLEDCRPFELLNLGKYERQYWQVATFGEDLDDDGAISLWEYFAFILKLYGASPTTGLKSLQGNVGSAYVHIGAVDSPVTIGEISDSIDECIALKGKELHVLGWEWEMGLHDPITEQAAARGVKLVLRQIPREVMEAHAAEKGDIQFFELAYLDIDLKPTKRKREYAVALRDFVIPNPELVPDDVREKIGKWSDYVDYWAVDWNFSEDTFMQGWVTYRTRKDRTLALESEPHPYDEPGEYAVMVKVIDIFGNDTSKIVPLTVA
jgi:DNA modification methylase